MSVTAVPLRPIARGSLVKLWMGLALLVAIAAAIVWAGTASFRPVRTPSGAVVQTVKSGSGPTITMQDVVGFHYKVRAKSHDAPVIQDSRQAGQPFVAPPQMVYPGLAEALQHMRQGGSYIVTLPPGTHIQTADPRAPFTPQDTLFFDIDVLQVERGQADRFIQMQQMQQMQQQSESGGAGAASRHP
jgi:FKBP-type peptidyl-prolyl cis-trans isomerase FkpA